MKFISRVARTYSRGFTFALLLMFLGASSASLFAQDNSTQSNQSQKSATYVNQPQTPSNQNTDQNATVQKKSSNLPYENYKGITDPDQAKEAWIKDHPESYPQKQEWVLPQTNFLKMEQHEMQAVLKTASQPEIQAFVKEVLNESLPTDYILPEAVRNAGDYLSAGNIIQNNYPEFIGLTGADFLTAIANNPLRYMEMIMEYKAARIMYGQSGNSNR